MTGTLILAGTPIGDPADATPRLRDLLERVEVVAAEDTRRARRLLDDLGVSSRPRLVSYYDAVEAERIPMLIEILSGGQDVAVITDAGMPGVSDPGYRLVVAAAAAGIRVSSVPGPSAVTTALALSGLAVDRFCFEGFLPRKGGERSRRLADLAAEPRTMVFFEAPHRLAEALSAMASAFGADRGAAVCRELTKTYEEVRRGGLAELAEWASEGVRGEITIVVAGATRQVSGGPEDWAEQVAVAEAAGVPRKEAMAEVAAAAGVPKRAVYDAVLAAKRNSAGSEEPSG